MLATARYTDGLRKSMKDEDWNETGIPLAYLITFRCYGTWLHGDERGSVDEFNNKYDMPFLPPNKKWNEFNKEILKYPPVKLDSEMRNAVESALRETCEIRGWQLLAINVRTNHAHSVVTVGNVSSKKVLSPYRIPKIDVIVKVIKMALNTANC